MNGPTDTPGNRAEPDARPAAAWIAPWMIHAAAVGAVVTVTATYGRTLHGTVDRVLTARAAGAPPGDEWVRFDVAGTTISVVDIAHVEQAPHPGAAAA